MYRPEFFSGLIFTTAQEVVITAKITFTFTSLSAVHIIDFHISSYESKTVVIKTFQVTQGVLSLKKIWSKGHRNPVSQPCFRAKRMTLQN